MPRLATRRCTQQQRHAAPRQARSQARTPLEHCTTGSSAVAHILLNTHQLEFLIRLTLEGTPPPHSFDQTANLNLSFGLVSIDSSTCNMARSCCHHQLTSPTIIFSLYSLLCVCSPSHLCPMCSLHKLSCAGCAGAGRGWRRPQST